MDPKETLRAGLRRVGYDVLRWPGRRRTLEDAFQHLAARGVRPATVIDVGVGYGTPELYTAFPDSKLLLVEPVAELEPTLQQIAAGRGEYLLAAASASKGTVLLSVEPNPEWSSVHGTGSQREVPTVRLDQAACGFPGPYLLKIDTQGAELEALEGAQRLLPETLAVALEVSLLQHWPGAPLLAEVVAWMADRGFAVYDIVGGHEQPGSGALAQLDVIFVPEHGPLRQTARYES